MTKAKKFRYRGFQVAFLLVVVAVVVLGIIALRSNYTITTYTISIFEKIFDFFKFGLKEEMAPPRNILFNCSIINRSGYYELGRDINYEWPNCPYGRGILIEAGDVILDCKNHTIRAINDHVTIAIHIGRNNFVSNVTVKNCRVEDTFEAIKVSWTENIKIKNNILIGNYHGIVVGDPLSGITPHNISLESNYIRSNKMPNEPTRGCPITVLYSYHVLFKDNYICDDIVPPCFYGEQIVYCLNSTIIDGGGNVLNETLTNCPIRCKSCPPYIFPPEKKLSKYK